MTALLPSSPLVWRLVCSVVATVVTVAGGLAQAAPTVHCEVRYASQTWQVTAQPTADPLSVPSLTLNKRFAFKAVARGAGERIDPVRPHG